MNRENLSEQMQTELLITLQTRFHKNLFRHPDTKWEIIEERLTAQPGKLFTVFKMEETGGEPDVVETTASPEKYFFFDCSVESPSGRRSLCYDTEAHNSRKQNKPAGSAAESAHEMGIELLTEEQYILLQKLKPIDTKTSSWIHTPKTIRERGGALFGDFRFGRVFIYHNGAESYYAARGYRGCIQI